MWPAARLQAYSRYPPISYSGAAAPVPLLSRLAPAAKLDYIVSIEKEPMLLKEKPLWLDSVAMPVIADRPLVTRVDVAIIGGGYTGLSAARTLAKGGAQVAVLEAETIGWGASSRNGGMV